VGFYPWTSHTAVRHSAAVPPVVQGQVLAVIDGDR